MYLIHSLIFEIIKKDTKLEAEISKLERQIENIKSSLDTEH